MAQSSMIDIGQTVKLSIVVNFQFFSS